MFLYLARPYYKFCKAKIEICVFVSKIWDTPYFVAKFTNTACEAGMLEELRLEQDFFYVSLYGSVVFLIFPFLSLESGNSKTPCASLYKIALRISSGLSISLRRSVLNLMTYSLFPVSINASFGIWLSSFLKKKESGF